MTNSPTVRLAIGGHRHPIGAKPNELAGLLVSCVYLPEFLRFRPCGLYRDWVMDSGAFSVRHSGTTSSLSDYVRLCRQMLATDPTLTEIYALDVIGDWRASLRNTELMWKAGIKAIPCYHIGEPLDLLRGLARDYPKIALGGVARHHGDAKGKFALRCMSAIWPKKAHGFGFGDEKHVLGIPFHSTDASSWESGPACFGRWHQFGKMSVSSKKVEANIRGEVQYYLELEKKARVRWAREMAELEAAKAA